MTIQKKSLISTLNTTKKATVANSPVAGTAVGDKKALAAAFATKGGARLAMKPVFATKGGARLAMKPVFGKK